MPNRPFLDVFTRKVSLLKDDIQRNSSLVNEVIPKLLEQVRNIDPLFTVDTLNTGEGIKWPMQTDATLLGPTCCVRLHGITTMLVLVVFSLKPVKHLGPYKRTQHCWPTTRKNVVTCCVRLHGPLEYERTYRGVNPDPWRWMRAGGRGGGGVGEGEGLRTKGKDLTI